MNKQKEHPRQERGNQIVPDVWTIALSTPVISRQYSIQTPPQTPDSVLGQTNEPYGRGQAEAARYFFPLLSTIKTVFPARSLHTNQAVYQM